MAAMKILSLFDGMQENKRSENMRLIDADTVEKYFYEHLDDLHMAVAMNAINEMPTIDEEPVKHGKWDCVNDDENIYMCTSCGYELCFDIGLRPKDYDFRFCPYCCAKMGEN